MFVPYQIANSIRFYDYRLSVGNILGHSPNFKLLDAPENCGPNVGKSHLDPWLTP